MVRKASEKDFEKIGAIWQECFCLNGAYLSLLSKHIFNSNRQNTAIYLLENNTEILSVLALLPIEFHKEKTTLRGAALSFVATPKKHRGNQYFHILFNRIFSDKHSLDLDFLLVRPATEQLSALYKREGFSIPIMNPMADSFDIPILSEVLPPLDATTIQKAQQALKPAFVWNKHILEFALCDAAENPKTASQLNFILSCSREVLKSSVPFAFVKSLSSAISVEFFNNAFFLITLE